MAPAKIEYTKINGSNVIGYFYYPVGKILYIKFKNEREYKYFDVSKEEFEKVKNAESFGKELRSVIITKKKYEEI